MDREDGQLFARAWLDRLSEEVIEEAIDEDDAAIDATATFAHLAVGVQSHRRETSPAWQEAVAQVLNSPVRPYSLRSLDPRGTNPCRDIPLDDMLAHGSIVHDLPTQEVTPAVATFTIEPDLEGHEGMTVVARYQGPPITDRNEAYRIAQRIANINRTRTVMRYVSEYTTESEFYDSVWPDQDSPFHLPEDTKLIDVSLYDASRKNYLVYTGISNDPRYPVGVLMLAAPRDLWNGTAADSTEVVSLKLRKDDVKRWSKALAAVVTALEEGA